MRLIAYTRVSTREQADSGLGLDAQAAAIRAAETSAPWSIARWASDPGVSGSRIGPELTAALAACKRGEADGIVAAKLDRLSRSLVDFTRLMERSRREGWHVVTLDLGVDTTTPAGEMVANVMVAFAQYERRLIGERTRDGLRQARERGTKLGATRTLPQSTIDQLLALRTSGVSLRNIALELNRAGVPTAKGKPWCVGSVRYVIRRYENESPCPMPERDAEIIVAEADAMRDALLAEMYDLPPAWRQTIGKRNAMKAKLMRAKLSAADAEKKVTGKFGPLPKIAAEREASLTLESMIDRDAPETREYAELSERAERLRAGLEELRTIRTGIVPPGADPIDVDLGIVARLPGREPTRDELLHYLGTTDK